MKGADTFKCLAPFFHYMLIIDNTKPVNSLFASVKDINLSGTNTYLLRFKNNQTSIDYYTLSKDLSSSGRYGQFNVSSSANIPLSSSLNLIPGYYTYYVYESSISGSVSSSLGLHEVDKGKLLVQGSQSISVSYSGSNAPTYYAYTGSIQS